MLPFLTPFLIEIAGRAIPGLAGALAGPQAKTVAEAIVTAGKSVFGENATEAQIEAKVAAEPALLDHFRERLQQEGELRKIDLEAYKVQVADTQDARRRDDNVRSTSGGVNARANIMLAGNFCCIIAITFGLLFYRQSMPDGIAAILGALIGNLATMLTQAFNFEFGSSRGSSEKSDQIAALVRK